MNGKAEITQIAQSQAPGGRSTSKAFSIALIRLRRSDMSCIRRPEASRAEPLDVRRPTFGTVWRVAVAWTQATEGSRLPVIDPRNDACRSGSADPRRRRHLAIERQHDEGRVTCVHSFLLVILILFLYTLRPSSLLYIASSSLATNMCRTSAT